MNKYIVAALVLFTVPAFAEERMVMRHLEPKQTKSISFDAPKGKSQITVYSEASNAQFSCKLSDENGQASEKPNTNKCEFSLDLKEPITVKLSLTNSSMTDPVDCRASFVSVK